MTGGIAEALAAGAYPTQDTRWVSGDERVGRDIARDDRAGPDHPERSNVAPGDDDGAGTDR
jgi:hypothetical protein